MKAFRKKITCLIAAGLMGAAMLGAGCTSSTRNTKLGGVIGAGVGAVTGAVIGHQKGRAGEGTAIGAAAGALGGAAIGSAMDEKKEDGGKYRR